MTTLVLHANQKAMVLFRDLEVLNSLNLSWVAGQLENCAAKILEGDKIRHLVQDGSRQLWYQVHFRGEASGYH